MYAVHALGRHSQLRTSLLLSPLAHFTTARRQVAASEGRCEAPVMDSSYMLGDPPAGAVDFGESPWRGCAVASRGDDEGSYEVRGHGHTIVVGAYSFESSGAVT